MAKMQTLAELKAENADEEVETDTPPQAVEEETEEEAAKDEAEVTEGDSDPESDAETPAEEPEETEVEDWMKGDESEGAEKKFTDSDIAAAKKKLKAKLESKDSELEEAKAEIERLKNGRTETKSLNRPKREDFYELEDPEAAYIEALTDFKLEQESAKRAAKIKDKEANLQQQQYQQEINKGVDQHYERAVKLAEESGIASETYQSADLAVRQSIDSVRPGLGDVITEGLIANLGEGSEKVFYSLGVNRAKRDKLVDLLKADPGGIKAAMYLGTLKAELTSPQKRKTNAPKPAPSMKGDATASASSSALKRKYDAAHKKGDTSAAFNIKRQAKKDGVDTKTW